MVRAELGDGREGREVALEMVSPCWDACFDVVACGVAGSASVLDNGLEVAEYLCNNRDGMVKEEELLWDSACIKFMLRASRQERYFQEVTSGTTRSLIGEECDS
jgi:hypothetical protein